jgi:hypothetical protein
MRTATKPESLSTLIKEADAVFSKYIRRRDANKTYSFYLNCFICGRAERVEFAHCMHFIDRDQMSVRYDEMNSHGGCETCNMFDPKHVERYEAVMIEKYGIKEVESLIWKSRSLAKFTRYELEEIIETYKQKLKSLIANK